MWKLVVSKGDDDPVESKNDHLGRQFWEFHPNLGTPEERAQVEKASEEFHNNRFHVKHSSDLLMRLQVIGLSVIGALETGLPENHQREICRYLYNHQLIWYLEFTSGVATTLFHQKYGFFLTFFRFIQGYNGSQLWDVVFAAQAILETKLVDRSSLMLRRAHEYIKNSQVNILKTSSVALLLSQMPSDIVGEPIAQDGLFNAVNLILTLQNNNGGFATYELTRSYAWLEVINPAETFGDIIIDYQYVECTSAAIQGLGLFMKSYPVHRRQEIEACITKAVRFIESIQLPDGSWYVIFPLC
ncbi:hypothetical protein RJ639_044638 [Escallonia herrerae]|uniref:Squalene cyclase C-terminal domain-containing protein n=1 Tax=Escallonia herrerae TaxID=1293975 RepID=A0AA88WBK2_9ASTE|nr:hypothetical protein RJ639_044638 [Escallonia herrerae]